MAEAHPTIDSPRPRPRARPRLSLWEALSCLPRDAQIFFVTALLCLSAPLLVSAYGAVAPPDDDSILGVLGRRPSLVTAIAVTLAALALVVLVRPRSYSLRNYVAHLRERSLEIHAHFDAAYRRRFPEPKENHDDVPSQPDP